AARRVAVSSPRAGTAAAAARTVRARTTGIGPGGREGSAVAPAVGSAATGGRAWEPAEGWIGEAAGGWAGEAAVGRFGMREFPFRTEREHSMRPKSSRQ